MKHIGKKLSITFFSLIVFSFFSLKIFCNIQYLSEIILSITAIVIFWYTYETMGIRKSEEEIARINHELLLKQKSPIVHFNVFNEQNTQFDTKFIIYNKSDYPVSVRICFNFTYNGLEIENNLEDYSGRTYWNLQTNEEKGGHFNLLQFISKTDLFSDKEVSELKALQGPDLHRKIIDCLSLKFEFKPWPRLLLDIEVFCENELGHKTYYPDSHYDYDFQKLVWIPTLTSKKPYWDFPKVPSWVIEENKIP